MSGSDRLVFPQGYPLYGVFGYVHPRKDSERREVLVYRYCRVIGWCSDDGNPFVPLYWAGNFGLWQAVQFRHGFLADTACSFLGLFDEPPADLFPHAEGVSRDEMDAILRKKDEQDMARAARFIRRREKERWAGLLAGVEALRVTVGEWRSKNLTNMANAQDLPASVSLLPPESDRLAEYAREYLSPGSVAKLIGVLDRMRLCEGRLAELARMTESSHESVSGVAEKECSIKQQLDQASAELDEIIREASRAEPSRPENTSESEGGG